MQNVHGQARPDLRDLNAVAAHALASLVCPSRLRETAVLPQPRDVDNRMPRGHLGRCAIPPASNSAAALSCLPSQLGRRVVMGDILGQVGALGRGSCCLVL